VGDWNASEVWASPSTHLPASWRALTRSIFTVGLAGLGAGLLVGGVGSRLVMRAASLLSPDVSGTGVRSEQGFRVGEVTLEGSIELLVFIGIFTGLFGAVYFAITRPWLMWAGKWHGAAFGLVLFAIGSATSDVFNPDNRDFVVLDNIPVIVLLFFALFVLFGVTIAWLYGWLDRRLPSSDDSGPMVAVYALASLLSLIIVAGAFAMLVTDEGCDCNPPLVAGSAFLVLAAATVALWAVARFTNGGSKVMSALTTVGWASLTVAVVAGAVRAISDISDIIAL
jgi:hypothetical protein